MPEKKVISFVCTTYPFLSIKYSEQTPKKELSFVHGTFQSNDPEEIEAVRQAIRRKAVIGLREVIYEEVTTKTIRAVNVKTEEQAKTESKTEESAKSESKTEEPVKSESKTKITLKK